MKKNKNEIEDLQNWVVGKYDDIIQQYHGVVVAVSGGVDSIALFEFFQDFTKFKKTENLHIFHVNYALRGAESEADERFVRDLGARYSVPVTVKKISDEDIALKAGKSLQEWARDIRYKEFRKFADKGYLIALAHHQDDLAENFLLRISRGAKHSAAAGMSEYDRPFFRPFLRVSKEAIREWANIRSLVFREDSSNDKIIYARNRVRHNVLPELETIYPKAKMRIAKFAEDACELADFASKKAVEEVFDPKALEFDRSKLMDLPPSVRREAMQRAFNQSIPERLVLSQALLAEIEDKMNTGSGAVQLLPNYFLRASREKLWITGGKEVDERLNSTVDPLYPKLLASTTDIPQSTKSLWKLQVGDLYEIQVEMDKKSLENSHLCDNRIDRFLLSFEGECADFKRLDDEDA